MEQNNVLFIFISSKKDMYAELLPVAEEEAGGISQLFLCFSLVFLISSCTLQFVIQEKKSSF